MNLEQALELYDAWRDRELEPDTERALIEFLESDSTAAMEYEMRDEALAALPRASRALPGLSDDMKRQLRNIGHAPSVGRRAPAGPMWARVAAALIIGMAIPYLAGMMPTTVSGDSVNSGALAALQNQFADLEEKFELAVTDRTDLERQNANLQGRLSALGPVADRVSELMLDNSELKRQLANISDGLDSVGGKVVNINQAMTGIGEEIQLLQQGRGSRVAVIRGDTPSQQDALRDLRENHLEWATVISPLVDAPDGELEIGPDVVNEDSIPLPAIHQILAHNLFSEDTKDNGDNNE